MAGYDDIKSDIIHGRPPNRGWFPKGKSGNPKGRPKKREAISATDTSVRDEFLKRADSSMTFTEKGKPVTMSQRQSVEQSQYIAAVKGSSHAQRNYLARDDQFRRERNLEILENHEYWRRYASAFDRIARGFADQNEQMPDYYPHPNELNFVEGKFVTGWRGLEPIQAAILRAHYIRMRDNFLLQAEKDRRHLRSKCELDNAAGLFGLVIDALLPKMVQLDAVGLTIRLGKQRALRKRELHRRLATAWVDVGFADGKKLIAFPIDEAAIKRALVKLRERNN